MAHHAYEYTSSASKAAQILGQPRADGYDVERANEVCELLLRISSVHSKRLTLGLLRYSQRSIFHILPKM